MNHNSTSKNSRPLRSVRWGRIFRVFLSGDAAPYRWTIRVPENALDGLKDARLQISYRGDIGTLWLGNEMISDNFCNLDTWEIGLLELKNRLNETMALNIAPIREETNVNVESAMAARSEEVTAMIAELNSISVQPVYEVKL